MKQGSEYRLAEKPCIDELIKLGYTYIKPEEHSEHRDSDNLVILRSEFVKAIQKINNIDERSTEDVYQDILRITDNQEFTKVLRGEYSRTIAGESTKRTIKLIDFLDLKNNSFSHTNQYYVRSQHSRIPDIVVFINGIPLVVIEAKSPLARKDKSGEAFDQIKQYERDIPRLFQGNLFNIVTDGRRVLYGATGSPSEFWGEWKDPYPKKVEDFGGDVFKMSLYALLDPARLLDLLAHFIVFETREGKTIKKICRYHQFRGVNKIIDRVVSGDHDKGLIWHTQGSGKSLSMVFTTLKLKAHLNIKSKNLENPNIMVLTDRIDLDDQIAKTFAACGLPNPVRIESIADLHKNIKVGTLGLTLISTIFKFQGSNNPVANSDKWIILVDECHRTQEKDLGAYLRKTFPNAKFFGFTGTPIKKSDKDTYRNFGAEGEGYLDKYGIDDAVADGATVPIHYVSRGIKWNVDPSELDRAFDMAFMEAPEDQLSEVKKRGVKLGELIKHPDRVEEIAKDIWAHYREFAEPDHLKAQIVAYDREAIIMYKLALNKVIAKNLEKREGLSPEDALKKADTYSACVYSANQEDGKPSENDAIDTLRKDLQRYFLDHDSEKQAKEAFNEKGKVPYFLIVCNKLLTGFDAPIEAVMYLDNPLTEHNLLQAIARTNRVWSGGKKASGLIMDYIGVSKRLDEALASYRSEDVQHAMQDLEELHTKLKGAHNEVMAFLGEIKAKKNYERDDFMSLKSKIDSKDQWFIFKRRVQNFVKAYSTLAPDPRVLSFTKDLSWLVKFVEWANPFFEAKVSNMLEDVSMKIRGMLEEHLEVSGIKTFCRLRKITDPDFMLDFSGNYENDQELQEAAVRKATELKKITEEKTEDNPERYGSFSEQVMAAIERYQQGQDSATELLKNMEKVAKELMDEDVAHTRSGLDPKAHDILVILNTFATSEQDASEDNFSKVASELTKLYEEAPRGWEQREQLRRELRGKVRRMAREANVEGWQKDVPAHIEEYALKHLTSKD
ncbi:MAG: type I restriction endonuclease subunit R [Deltaproteobacteria bacterium]|nr:type I restriction endonuclease subunit R [Deltaproteobacteria bacterium]